jgi:hypothetical protein
VTQRSTAEAAKRLVYAEKTGNLVCLLADTFPEQRRRCRHVLAFRIERPLTQAVNTARDK